MENLQSNNGKWGCEKKDRLDSLKKQQREPDS